MTSIPKKNKWASGPKGGKSVSAAKPPSTKSVRRWRVQGQGLVEYAMLIALIVIVALVMVAFLGDVVSNGMYSRINSGFPSPP